MIIKQATVRINNSDIPATSINTVEGAKHTYVNLTTQDVTLVREGHESIVFPKSGIVARVSPQVEPSTRLSRSGISKLLNYHTVTFGDIENLPNFINGVTYIVSSLVFDATCRDELVTPSEVAKNASGQVEGYKGFRVKPF